MSDQKAVEATVVFVVSTDAVTGKPVVLLGRKSPQASFGAGKLVPPGGKCEPNEPFDVCAVRECKEELDIEIDPSALEYVADFHSFKDGKPFFHVVIYIATAYRGELVESLEMRPEWHPIDALPFGEMLDGDHAWVSRVLRGERLTVVLRMASNMWSVLVLPMVAGAEKAAADL